MTISGNQISLNGNLSVLSGSSPNDANLLIGFSGSNNYYDANAHIFRNGALSEEMRISSTGNVGIGSTSPRASLDISQSTGAIILPIGTTGAEPGTPVNGMIRYNSSIPDLEAYIGNFWTTLTSSGPGDAGLSLGTSASVTNPQRTGDPTTGLFSPAASTVAIATGGVQQLTVNSSGYVGIGTTSPIEKLNVNGAIAAYGASSGYSSAVNTAELDFSSGGARILSFGPNSSTNGTFEIYLAGSDNNSPITPFYINGSGSVGIGVTTFTWNTVPLLTAIAGAKDMTNAAAAGGNQLGLIDTTSMVQGVGGALNFFGNYTGTTAALSGVIDTAKSNAIGGDYSFDMRFITRQNGTPAAQERMRIMGANGNVGIGSTSPQATLDVNGTARLGGSGGGLTVDGSNIVNITGGNLSFANSSTFLNVHTNITVRDADNAFASIFAATGSLATFPSLLSLK